MTAMTNSLQFAAQIRMEALKMVTQAKASHIGGALSMTDLLADHRLPIERKAEA